MKTGKISIFLLLSIFILNGCGQISKEIAKDQLSGTYAGKIQIILKYSVHNIGIEDVQMTEDYSVSITKNEYGTYLLTPDGKIGLNNIVLLSNGASFNIYEQTITNKEGMKLQINGNAIYLDTDGNKSDGQFNSDINLLQYSWYGKIKAELLGMYYDTPIEVYCELQKKLN